MELGWTGWGRTRDSLDDDPLPRRGKTVRRSDGEDAREDE